MKVLLAFIAGMRPRQWTKNLILLLGVLFAKGLGTPTLVWRSLAAFLMFCLLSGTIYLFNDRMDLGKDRLHPRKRLRPLASGALPLGAFNAGLPLLFVAAMAGSWYLGVNFFIVSAIFLVMNLLYTLWMKHQVILDVFGIAGNFVLRAVAGVVVLADHIELSFAADLTGDAIALSPWLLLCTFFGALFLAFSKRRAELLGLDDPSAHRSVLAHYSPALLDQLVSLSAGTVILAYALYTLWSGTTAQFGQGILVSNLFVDFGVMRYLFLVYKRDWGGDPSEVLLRDKQIGVAVLLWVISILACVFLSS